MAFVVEMCFGKRGFLDVIDFDKEGNPYVTETIKNGEQSADWREFSCSMWHWDDTVELGRKLGWKPKGTVFEKSEGKYILSDYRPNEWYGKKLFQADDAKALAAVLEIGQQFMYEGKLEAAEKINPVLIREGVSMKELIQLNAQLTPMFLKNFIAFLKRGQFYFAYDD